MSYPGPEDPHRQAPGYGTTPPPQYGPGPAGGPVAPGPGYGPGPGQPPMSNPYKDKTTVLLLGIFLGTIGVHRFYLGGKANMNRGWLLLGLTVGGWLLSFLIIGFGGVIAAAVLVIIDLVKHGELTDQANAEIASGMRR